MIEIKNLHKSFGKQVVTDGVNLTVNDGEFLAIIGRSGEGKSVLLKQIIGLIKPDEGDIIIDNVNLKSLHTVKEKESIFKKCGYVFQFAALLDSLNIFENVGITMLEAGDDPEKVRALVVEKMASVGLGEDILNRFPNELSGGMKKRVGLARTLMLNPEIILYDEPTTGLDPITVRMIHELIKQVKIERKVTTVVVSHDLEIFNYADRVAMLFEGKIVYIGAAKDVWQSDNPYIYQFIRGLPHGPLEIAKEKPI